MAAAVIDFSVQELKAKQELNTIIDSIELHIQHLCGENPVLIYIGVGTYAGLVRDENGIKILDDENYHQFPPALQKLFIEVPNLSVFCIYIDPSLENIPFITQDERMKQKMNLGHWTNHHNFCFENKRIMIYPFRHSIIVNSTKLQRYYDDRKIVNITEEIERLHQITISESCTYVYHDFSGNDNVPFIEKYFNDSIENHLNHIIYGFGNGSISGCYYDFRKPEAHLAYVIEKTQKRPMISVFNFNHTVSRYIKLDNKYKEIYGDFTGYLSEITESYGEQNTEIITSIMCSHINNFITQFRDYILYVLRYIKDAEEKYEKGENPTLDITTYGFNNVLDNEMMIQIRSIFNSSDKNMFNKVVDIIALKYQFEFNIIGRKHNLTAFEFLHKVVSDADKYKWYNQFIKLYE